MNPRRRQADTGGPRRDLRCRVSFRLLAIMATAGIVAATTLALTRVNDRRLTEIIERETQSNLLLEARNLASLSSEALLGEFPELTLVPLVKDLQAGRPDLVEILVLDHAGRIRGGPEPRDVGADYTPPASLEPLAGRVMLNPGERMSADSGRIQVETPVVHPSEDVIGQVVVGVDRGTVGAKIRGARVAMLKTAAWLLAVAAAVVTLIMTILFRPIGTLREGLQRIGGGDLETPIRVRGPAELMSLAQNLNQMARQLRASRQLADAREAELIATQREVILTLGEVVESRSLETANHTRRVGAMSAELATLAGLPREEAELLRMAAPMHDVGKIGIPDSILNKPGKLTLSEYEAMKAHAEIGHRILASSERPILKAAAIIAHEHHERWDGSGYPRGLVREEIHIYGRIVSLVDVFDALTSDRVYRKAMDLEDVLSHVREERGRMFDPELADLFLTNIERFVEIAERLRDSADTPRPAPADAFAQEHEPEPLAPVTG